MKRTLEEKKFERYCDVLAKNLTDASHHSKLYWMICGLAEAEYVREINQSRLFWSRILESLELSSVLTLSRIYDKNKTAFHLQKFLKFIENNLHIFTEEAFVTRLENDGREWRELIGFNRIPSKEELQRDKVLVDNKDSLVNRLIQIRNHAVAHTNEQLILGQLNTQKWPTWDVFNQLLERGLRIINYYRTYYDGYKINPQDSWNEENYRLIFKHLRIAGLALDFVNLKSRTLDSGDCMDTIHQFVTEVRKEIYKQQKS